MTTFFRVWSLKLRRFLIVKLAGKMPLCLNVVVEYDSHAVLAPEKGTFPLAIYDNDSVRFQKMS